MISLSPFVRSKAIDIEQDVQKLRIITDPKIHYDLLRLCQHTRLSFFARNVPPDVMMRHADGPVAVPYTGLNCCCPLYRTQLLLSRFLYRTQL